MRIPDDGLERRQCACGRWFVAVYDWVKDCRVCFHEKGGHYDLAVAELAWERGYLLGLERARDRNGADVEAALGELPIHELLTLCHPDRHPPERFELANQITAWLNGLRDTRG
jgi:hypothetical protein